MTDTSTDPITEHNAALLRAFANVVKAEREKIALTAERDAAEARLKPRIAAADKALADAWSDVECLMSATGETEVLIPYDADLVARVHYTPPGVKCVADAEACPDEYVKVERKAKLNDIKRDFFELWKAGAALPNWLAFEAGEPKLTWSPAKAKAAKP